MLLVNKCREILTIGRLVGIIFGVYSKKKLIKVNAILERAKYIQLSTYDSKKLSNGVVNKNKLVVIFNYSLLKISYCY